MRMTNILVTGGAGFIGSHLVEKLLDRGDEVISIDNFDSFYEPAAKERNVRAIMRHIDRLGLERSSFRPYRADITDKDSLRCIFDANRIDMVVHLAAMAGVRPSMENPELYLEVNINGTLNMLEACRRCKVKKFVFASSSSVYGDSRSIPFRETDPADRPVSPYAASKRAGELLCHTYHYLYDMSIACLRFFTVYGPRQRPDLAVRKFARLILEGEPVTVFGDGTSARDYTYIDDITDGIVKAMDWAGREEKRYEIFNLGGSRAIPLSGLVSTLEEVLGKKAVTAGLPRQAGDVEITCADIDKAARLLGYSPQKAFREGIEDFAGWLRAGASE